MLTNRFKYSDKNGKYPSDDIIAIGSMHGDLMDRMIAYCGLDCGKCEAYIATKNDDDDLRRKVAKEWSELYKVEITKEMINCDGCRMDGRKTPFCESMCPIRICSSGKGFDTCGRCPDMGGCPKLKMIVSTNSEALERLKTRNRIIE